jgi:HPt (histidine-containing phosphotransfer) domain-containing protein
MDTPGSSPLDIAEMRRRLDDDDALIADVISLFLDSVPPRMTALQEALEAGDRPRLKREAHSLKGAGGNLAATPFVSLSASLEAMSETASLDALRGALAALAAEGRRLADALTRLQGGAAA